MKQLLSVLGFGGALSFFIFSSSFSHASDASNAVQWDSTTHQEYYVDVTGDGVKDLLLQPVNTKSSFELIKGEQFNFTTQYRQDSSLYIEQQLDDMNWSGDEAELITGFFNDDAFEDVLVIFHSQSKAYLLRGSSHGLLDFKRFNDRQLKWLSQSEVKQYYTGDFNGDTLTDILVLMTDTGKHRIYHSQPDSHFKLAQKIQQKSRWGLKKTEKLYIADFNGDGRDDIFALAKKRKSKHFIAYANEEGIFKRKNVDVLDDKFTDYEWIEDGYSTAVVQGEGANQLVRLYNQNGGKDENGRFIPDEHDPLRHEKCKVLYFKPGSKGSGKRCHVRDKVFQPAPRGRVGGSKSAMRTQAVIQADATTQQTTTTAGGEGSVIPDTPTTGPVSSVGAYPAVNETFTLTWDGVANATKYQIYVSYDYGATKENTYQYTSGTSFSVTETYSGSRFYYIKACNASGCSGLSPYQSVYIYSVPKQVPLFVASPTTVQAGETINLSWTRPEGVIGTGGYYKIQETRPDGSTRWLPTLSGGQTTSTTSTLSAGQGQYNYTIVACNKTDTYCSDASAYEANAAVVPPAEDGSAVINNLTYTPVVVPVGKAQNFSFDYLNSTWCRNSLGNDYVGSSSTTTEDTGQYNWSANRTSAATWEFDVVCSNANNSTSYTQHVQTIITANTNPIAYDDVKTVSYGTSAVIRVLDNDVDDDGHTLTISHYSQPYLGTVSCTDVCTYTAPGDSSSNVRTNFTYTITDGWGGSYTAQAVIDLIAATPDPQVTISNLQYSPQTVTVGYSQSFSFSYTNARKCESSLGVVYVADNGQLQSGTYSWGPVERTSPGTWDFSVTCSNNDNSASGDVLGVIEANTAPVAVDDSVTVEQYSANNVIDVLNNDSDADGHALIISQVSQPLNGVVSITSDSSYVTYSPKNDFTGTETFTYIADDGWGGTAQGIVTVTVGEGSGPNTGLIVEYLFEDANNLGFDSSGNGNHATIDGSPIQANGKIGFAMDTTNGALDNLPGFNKGQMVTINFWFKANQPGYLMQQGYWEGGYPAWELRPVITSGGDLEIIALGDDGATRNNIFMRSGVNDFKRSDIWFMVSLITDGNYLKAFVSDGRGGVQWVGEDNSIGPSTWSASQPKSARKIGALCYYGNSNCANGYHYFNGQIDNYRMYGRALTRAEIEALYAETSSAPNNVPTGEVIIGGVSLIGGELMAVDTLADVDGLGTFSYQWQRHKDGYDFDIEGATASSYTVTANDIGYTLSVTVSYTDGAGHAEQVSSAESAAVPVNTSPTISVISDVTIDENATSDSIAFTVGDTTTSLGALQISALSSNLSLIPDNNILIEPATGSTGEDYTLTLTPLADVHGDAIITVTVSDGEFEESSEFTLTVNPVADGVFDWSRTGGTVASSAFTGVTAPTSTFNGATPGEAGVSGGGGVYQIPIVVPPGRAGMQPGVSLSYSSRGGNGLAGVGWSLSAGSSISRCPSTQAQDGVTRGIDFSANDKLCLDGQRLMVVSGTYGQDGAEYRTEIESMVEVSQSGVLGANTTFTVTSSTSGSVSDYGSDNDSRIIPAGVSVPLSWLIDSQADVSGENTMTYSYSDYGDGEVLLDEIRYTGTATETGNRGVRFTYENRNHYRSSWLAGGKTRTSKRLSKITTHYADNGEFYDSDNSTKVREYSLTYNSASTASGRSLLRKVQECAYQDSVAQCREASTFSWTDAGFDYAFERFTSADGEDMYPTEQKSISVDSPKVDVVTEFSDISFAGDMNGDGVRDWRRTYSDDSGNLQFDTRFVNAERQVETSSDFQLRECHRNPITYSPVCFTPDFNLDGRSDSYTIDSSGDVILLITEEDAGDYSQRQESTGITLDITSPEDFIVNISDYNGDGWPDLVVDSGTGLDRVLRLYLHSGSVTNAYSGSGTVLRSYKRTIDGAIVTNINPAGDMNGDGLSDFTVAVLRNGNINPTLYQLLLTDTSGGDIAFNVHTVDFRLDTAEPAGDFDMLIDINGDGLADWFGWPNRGNGYHAAINHGDGNFDTPSPVTISGGTIPNRVTQLPSGEGSDPRALPRFADSFKPADINGDGLSDILMPGGDDSDILVEGCQVIQDQKNGDFTACGSELYGMYYSSETDRHAIPSDWDRNIYRYEALTFEEQADGSFEATLIDTPLIGAANRSLVVDTFGKGLPDMVFTYGCESPDGQCSMKEPRTDVGDNPMIDLDVNNVYINRNQGDSQTASSLGLPSDYYPVDMMVQSNNGVGLVSTWVHRPLSSDYFSSDNQDYYTMNFAEVVDNAPAGDYFHFASSMYTVGQFTQSNGIGGSNQTNYKYDGAVYSTQGYGFRGFNAITQIDHANGVTTHTDFAQAFPFSSTVENQWRFEGTDVDVISQSTFLSHTQNNWEENPTQKSTWKSAGIWQLYNPKSISKTYTASSDSSGAGNLVVTTTTLLGTTLDDTDPDDDIDQYGNISSKVTSVEDDYGVYTTIEKSDYSLADDDWTNRYESRTVVKKAVDRTSSLGITDIGTGTDTDKTIKTEIDTWNTTHRKPGTIKVLKDGITEITTTNTTYNDYGLPTKVTVTGDVLKGSDDTSAQQIRVTTTTYSKNGQDVVAGGYFPYKITQKANSTISHSTTTEVEPRTGLPTQVTDIAGIVTTTVYDALARPVSMDKTGYPIQYLSYHDDASDDHMPTNGVMSIRTTQEGSPSSREYKDLLGRTLRVVTQGFDGSDIYKDTEYNSRGLTSRESNVYFASETPAWTVYSNYDVLGRVQSKTTPQTNGQLNTSYSFNKLTTNIDVQATVSDVADLEMSRTYNALEQLVKTVDADGGSTEYAYDGSGNPIVIRDANGNGIIARYDALGRKDYVDDPNQGKTDFIYNDFGELEKETDANGKTIRYDVDLLGRVLTRIADTSTGTETASFVWDTQLPGLLTSQSLAGQNVSKAYTYDNAGRVTQSDVTIDGTTYTTTTAYDDNYGRPLSMTYPKKAGDTDGLTISYLYNALGYLQKEVNANSEFVYREITSQDAFGNIETALLNDSSLNGQYLYHGKTGQMLSSTVSLAGTPLHQLSYTLYDSYGNLKTQQNTQTGATDEFTYDKLHRLTQSDLTINSVTDTIEYGYDAVGNITKKSDYSQNSANAYQYTNGTNQISQITLKDASTVTYGYDNKGNQTHRNGTQEVTYNVFNKPVSITKNSSNIQLFYGAYIMRYKQIRVVDNKTITTHYIDKHYEVEMDDSNNQTRKSYISDVAIITDSDTDGHSISFTHRDRLGSAATFTDHNNQIVATRHFDPFGKPRAGDWSQLEKLGLHAQLRDNPQDSLMDTRRGFTDHEHLDEAELIHMNGRVYDYNVGRFMSVDPVIQAPSNTQSINPYSYIMNNPMAGTDPSGYEADTAENIDKRYISKPPPWYMLDSKKGQGMSNGNVNYNPEVRGNSTDSSDLESSEQTNASSQGSSPSVQESLVEIGGTTYKLEENFNTKETNSYYVSDASGSTIPAYTFTKPLDSLTVVESNSLSGGGSTGDQFQGVANSVGLGILTGTLAEVSKADWLPPSKNVSPHAHPKSININLGKAPPGVKPLLPISSFAKQLSHKLLGAGIALSVGMAIEGVRQSNTENQKLSYMVKGAFDVSVSILTYALGANPVSLGLAATYFALDYYFDFRSMIELNLNRTRRYKRSPSGTVGGN